MTISFSDLILKLKKYQVPPVIRGAKAMIELLVEEDNKVKEFAKQTVYIEKTYEREDLSEIIRKYGVKDYKKDLYIFIKPSQSTV